jgi:hypothetical protein
MEESSVSKDELRGRSSPAEARAGEKTGNEAAPSASEDHQP